MSKSTILVILVAILAAQQAAAQPNYLTETCRSIMGNYTTNSTYEANIKTVLSDLDIQSSNASFFNTSAGSSSASQVFGQYYYRADINSSLSNDCIKEAAKTILKNCHNFKSAVVWYEECTLRYDNVSMVGVEAERPSFFAYGLVNVTDPDKFGAVVNKTMARLINESAYGGGNPSFFRDGGRGRVALVVPVCDGVRPELSTQIQHQGLLYGAERASPLRPLRPRRHRHRHLRRCFRKGNKQGEFQPRTCDFCSRLRFISFPVTHMVRSDLGEI
ncbi:hypothetical protein V2J09_020976 [Rumex salicifolius]